MVSALDIFILRFRNSECYFFAVDVPFLAVGSSVFNAVCEGLCLDFVCEFIKYCVNLVTAAV